MCINLIVAIEENSIQLIHKIEKRIQNTETQQTQRKKRKQQKHKQKTTNNF